MCIDICTINIRVSIRVRGFHLVFLLSSNIAGWQGQACTLFPFGELTRKWKKCFISGCIFKSNSFLPLMFHFFWAVRNSGERRLSLPDNVGFPQAVTYWRNLIINLAKPGYSEYSVQHIRPYSGASKHHQTLWLGMIPNDLWGLRWLWWRGSTQMKR